MEINLMDKFTSMPKIPRLNRDMIITEKIDGTNVSILITEDGVLQAASRTRWITPTDDNYGFAKWVEENKDELLKLGPGQHFGEWWGKGIQRGYNQTEKRFSLFNTFRWNKDNIPNCVSVVPELKIWTFDTNVIKTVLHDLTETGSIAAPGFMNPEGIVVFHTANQNLFKVTIKDDEKPKSKV